MESTPKRSVVWCHVVLWLGCATASGQVSGRIVGVGLSGAGAATIREGNWTYVEVQLSYRGRAPLNGVLEVEQYDRDGDIVRYRSPAALGPGDTNRRFRVYFVPQFEAGANTLAVRLLETEPAERLVRIEDERSGGELRDALSAESILPLPAEIGLILDVSEPPLKLLGYEPALAAGMAGRGGAAKESRWRVRRLDPRSLPERWQGLEPVDVIVWDDPDPSTVSATQIDALGEWVRFGGRLVFSGGANWQAVGRSKLANLLPGRITGSRLASEVQEFSQKILSDMEHDLDAYYAVHPVMRCTMVPFAGSIPVPSDPRRLAGLEPIAMRRNIGRGTATFVGASLRELLAPVALPRADIPIPDDPQKPDPQQEVRQSANRSQRALFEKLLGVRADQNIPGDALDRIDLFDLVRATIGFQTISFLYLLAAVAFAIGYSFTATIGSFWWLQRRNKPHQSWTAFALIAGAGTTFGTTAVWWLRGVVTRVEQMSVLDGSANASLGVAHALFGVKTPRHTEMTVRLPSAGAVDADDETSFGSVRTLPDTSLGHSEEGGFVAPKGYTCSGAGLALERVPIRATLKELEGDWEGLLGGRIEAQVRMGRVATAFGRVERFMPGTFIRNRLELDLRNCYLIETSEDTAIRAALIRCYRLGDLPARGPSSTVDETTLNRLTKGATKKPGSADESARAVDLPTLQEAMQGWCSRLTPLSLMKESPESVENGENRSAAEEALLLLSTMDVYVAEEIQPRRPLAVWRSQGRRYSCLHQLTRETAILIGFGDGAPAVQLSEETGVGRWRKLTPTGGVTMYRIVIPVERDVETK